MSVAALTMVFSAKIGKASTKSVLVALADRADDVTGTCFPSVRDIIERTELDRKTVLSCLKELEHRKYLQDTGKRCGKTNQVKVWYLDLALIQATSVKASKKWNSSAIPPKQSHFPRRTVPEMGHGTTNESSLNYHLVNSAGVVVDDESIGTSTPVWQKGELHGGLEEFITSACWMQNRIAGIRNPAGFKSKIRRRLTSLGPSPEDWETFTLWRAALARHASPEAAEDVQRADEKRRRLVDAKQRYSAMEAVQQQELKFQFATHLRATNNFVYKAYKKSGLDSSVVAGAFHEWLVGELL